LSKVFGGGRKEKLVNVEWVDNKARQWIGEEDKGKRKEGAQGGRSFMHSQPTCWEEQPEVILAALYTTLGTGWGNGVCMAQSLFGKYEKLTKISFPLLFLPWERGASNAP
jgi:hypothetical protein